MVFFLLYPSLASAASLRGYQKGEGYQFAVYGEYPYEKDGTKTPLLWRVLTVKDDVAFMITEYIIDFVDFHTEKDLNGPELQYADSYINQFCNSEGINNMFTAEEQATLNEMEEGRGKLACGSGTEFLNTEAGFRRVKIFGDNMRKTQGTPYSYHKGLRKIHPTNNSWYWTGERRGPGYRFIVGDDGHISTSGITRKGGLRPVVYLDLSKVSIKSGEGTKESPFILTVRKP